MALKFYNTLTRKKETFKPIKKGFAGIYTCGPTVYDFAHIGNFRAYVWEDLLRRWLEYMGYTVKQVQNLTDVDDKTIKGSKKEGMPLEKYTERYKKAFFEDVKRLNIERAEHYPAATGHIAEMVALIRALLTKGYAYKAESGDIYYSIAKFREYGKLSHFKLKKLEAGKRVKADEYDKEHAQDFALWKAWSEDDGNVFWETELGKGRPGWHIECSAMSMKYLGETFDIHTGGIDNMFPHHENEIAQSEGATGKRFVNCWMHCAHLVVNGQKMSKSLGNFYTVRDLIEKEKHSPAALRYVLLSAHYREELNFTLAELESAEKTVERLNEFAQRMMELAKGKGAGAAYADAKSMSAVGKGAGTAGSAGAEGSAAAGSNAKNETAAAKLIGGAKEKFESTMDDDLNTPLAFAALFEFVREANRLAAKGKISRESAKNILGFMQKINSAVAVMSFAEKAADELGKEEKKLVDEREAARKSRNFAKADEIREELRKRGIILNDTPQGIRWKRVSKVQ